VTYDDIIVGAGSSGAVLAARLSEDLDRRVLLFEAGPDYASLAEMPADLLYGWQSLVDHDWGWTALAVDERSIPYPRGKVIGGSSSVNGTIALRGHRSDFEEWVSRGLPEWSWDEVLPFYRKLEDDPEGAISDPWAHGVGGPMPIQRVGRADWQPFHAAFHAACLGAGFADCVDFNASDASGVGVWPRNTRDGVRMSTALTYLAGARGRPNLEIRSNALVDKVVIEAGRAVAVEVVVGGSRERVSGGQITLAAGAVASPPILLRSGVGPAGDLRALGIAVAVDRPGVGAVMLDHPAIGLPGLPSSGASHDLDVVTEVGMRYTAAGSSEPNDMQLYFATLLAPELTRGRLPEPRPLFTVGPALVRPYSTGRLTIATADPTHQPVLELNYLADSFDLTRMIEGLRLGRDLCRSPELTGLVDTLLIDDATLEDDDALADMVRSRVTTTFHPAGTAPMGSAADDRSVVDSHGRVHGVDRLRVVDASIMPTSVRCNTNITCVMLAERIASWMTDGD
jgi:choline dehydrogenase